MFLLPLASLSVRCVSSHVPMMRLRNVSGGGDWVMESDGINIKKFYFDLKKSKRFGGTFECAGPDGSEMDIPEWLKLAEKLPTAKEERKERKALFSRFDPNGNGYLSLAEIDKGLIETFGLHGGDMFSTKRCKPAIMRAYQAAKDIGEAKSDLSDDYVTKKEFRLLLVYLRRYFELLAMFDEVDTGDDRRVDFKEFKAALPMFVEWGVKVTNPRMAFDAADEDGMGMLLFDEFSGWALTRGLEMLEDDAEEGEESLVNQHKTSKQVLGIRGKKKVRCCSSSGPPSRPYSSVPFSRQWCYVALVSSLLLEPVFLLLSCLRSRLAVVWCCTPRTHPVRLCPDDSSAALGLNAVCCPSACSLALPHLPDRCSCLVS